MPEHKVCMGCRWNHYPFCYGNIMTDGSYMNIEHLKLSFECGQKNYDTSFDMSQKSKMKDLEDRIAELESKVNVVGQK